MKRLIIVIFSILYCIECATLNFLYKDSFNAKKIIRDGDVGESLYLTEYIENGNTEEGKKEALVQHSDLQNLTSYAGYLTINKTYDSNTFFWFFPSQTNPKTDPVMVWMVGGPGLSICQSIFTYNGPLNVNEDIILEFRKESYNTNHSIIYIDSPIGSGYSYTKSELGYSTNANETARDVLLALVQFFKIFPEYKKNDFYVGGDSYAGKYVVTVADAIREHNNMKLNEINIRGLVIGNGVLDPHNQTVKADFLYTAGLFDINGLYQYKALEINSTGKTQFLAELFKNLTGYKNDQNILTPGYSGPHKFYYWLESASVRKALHVGNITCMWKNDDVKNRTKDLGKSVTTIIENLLDKYKVLFYNGQLDTMLPYTSSIKYYRGFKWSGSDEFGKAKRTKLWLNGELIGYGKFVRNLTEVLVRNAGHVASSGQLVPCSNILTAFTHNESYLIRF